MNGWWFWWLTQSNQVGVAARGTNILHLLSFWTSDLLHKSLIYLQGKSLQQVVKFSYCVSSYHLLHLIPPLIYFSLSITNGSGEEVISAFSIRKLSKCKAVTEKVISIFLTLQLIEIILSVKEVIDYFSFFQLHGECGEFQMELLYICCIMSFTSSLPSILHSLFWGVFVLFCFGFFFCLFSSWTSSVSQTQKHWRIQKGGMGGNRLSMVPNVKNVIKSALFDDLW